MSSQMNKETSNPRSSPHVFTAYWASWEENDDGAQTLRLTVREPEKGRYYQACSKKLEF